MYSDEVENALKDYDCFVGAHSCNVLPEFVLKKPAAVIINTDPWPGPGEHWVAVYLHNDDNNTGIYFDSFGNPPQQQDIVDFLENNCSRWYTNNNVLQHPLATSCGQYCILFVKLMCSGYSFEGFLELFTRIPQFNESLLENVYKKIKIKTK